MLNDAAESAPDPVGLWTSPGFVAELQDWVSAVCAAQGMRPTAMLRPHRIRFWAAVFTQATDAGTLWVKAPSAGQGFEGQLLQTLSRLVPDHVLAPLAVHSEHGWILMPDGGPTVKDGGEVNTDTWHGLVRQVARLQLDLAGHGQTLRAAGLPVLLPERAHEYISELVDVLTRLPLLHPQRIDRAAARELERHLPGIARDWEAMGESSAPVTLQLNDAGPGNVFYSTGPEAFRFFDLGDAFWSHPSPVLQVPIRMASGSWPHPAPREASIVHHLHTAYRDVWSSVGIEIGAATIESADRLASVHRCESWRRLLANLDQSLLGVAPPRLLDWLNDAVLPRP